MIGVSLFAGIGGFDLAMARNGIHVSTAVEIDKDCRHVLGRHFRYPATETDVTIYADVKETKGDDLGPCDIITAGWPCQGNSVAGRRGGMGDPRSGLWGDVARLLDEARPAWFLGENVPGLLTVNRGRDFGIILQSLDELGYGVAWRVLDAQNFGVPQRRRRLFIAGCLGDGASAAEILFEPGRSGGDFAPRAETPEGRHSRTATVSTLQGGGKRGYRIDAEGACGNQLVSVFTKATHAHGPAGSEAADETWTPGITAPALSTFETTPSRAKVLEVVGTLDAHDGPHGHGGANVQTALAGHYIPAGVGVRRLTPLEWERLQGFPDHWTAGQADGTRYRQLGNAVAVPVAEWITRRIAGYQSTHQEEAEAA